MAINKVVIGENTVMDISTDTLEEASSLPQNVTAHNKNGELITGTATKQNTETIYISDIEQTPPSLSGPLYVLPECEYTVDLDPTEREKLVSGNIKKDVTILGVPGTYDPLEDKEYCVSGSLADKTVTSYYLPSSVTEVGNYAFQYCTVLTSINTSNITSIMSYSFRGCTVLNNIDTSRVTSVGAGAFRDCTSLTNIDLSNVIKIEDYAFYVCSALTSIDASSATSIGQQAFRQCVSLTDINVSNAGTIGGGAFYDCTKLTNIQVKNGVKITPFTYLCKIATINGHLYYQRGTSSNNIYCDDTTGEPIVTFTVKGATFTDEYGVTFTRVALENSYEFTITW